VLLTAIMNRLSKKKETLGSFIKARDAIYYGLLRGFALFVSPEALASCFIYIWYVGIVMHGVCRSNVENEEPKKSTATTIVVVV
jgi:hypothetical protein